MKYTLSHSIPGHQLEQTGSTIFQTLAGLALDIKSKKHAEKLLSPIDGDERDIQYLLNAFLILNVLQLAAIVGLARLHHRQRKAAERLSSALLPSIMEETDGESSAIEEHGTNKKEPVDEWQGHDTSLQVPGSRQGTVRSTHSINHASGSRSTSRVSESSIPLLSESQSGSARSSRYLIDTSSNGKVVRTRKEVRRGELFAVISACGIAFAWILFMGVALVRLRSKEERGIKSDL